MSIERRVRIIQDRDPCNPRTDWDCHSGRMLCWHSRYELGDTHNYDSDDWKRELACEVDPKCEEAIEFVENDSYDIWHEEAVDSSHPDPHEYAYGRVRDAVANIVERAFDAGYVALPLSLYDHGGITMSTGAPTCPWDSGYVGVIICDNATIEKEFGGDRDKALAALESEVEVYNQYLCGDVYGYIVEEREEDCCSKCEREHDWKVVDSCSGFYGSDFETNGLLENMGAECAELAKSADIEY